MTARSSVTTIPKSKNWFGVPNGKTSISMILLLSATSGEKERDDHIMARLTDADAAEFDRF